MTKQLRTGAEVQRLLKRVRESPDRRHTTTVRAVLRAFGCSRRSHEIAKAIRHYLAGEGVALPLYAWSPRSPGDFIELREQIVGGSGPSSSMGDRALELTLALLDKAPPPTHALGRGSRAAVRQVDRPAAKSGKAFEKLARDGHLTAVHRKELRELAESVIDRFITSEYVIGPLIDENGWRHFGFESTEGVAGVIEHDGGLFLHVRAVVMTLPSHRDTARALMRAALKMNYTLPLECRLAIRGNRLVVATTANMGQLLAPAEYDFRIFLVMTLATAVGNRLRDKYS